MSRTGALAGAAVGVVLGALASVWSYYTAQAAVEVRPRLAEVGLVDAALTGHGWDWIYFHHPLAGACLSIAIVGAVLAVVGWSA